MKYVTIYILFLPFYSFAIDKSSSQAIVDESVVNELIDSTLYYIHSDYIEAKRIIDKAIEKSRELNDTILIAKSLMIKGRTFHLNGYSKEGRILLHQALDLLNNKDNGELLKAEIYDNLGLNLRNHRIYAKAKEYYDQSMKIRVAIKDTHGIVNILANLSCILREKSDEFYLSDSIRFNKYINESFKYLDSALMLLRLKPNKQLYAEIHYFKAVLFDRLNYYSSSFKNLKVMMDFERNFYGVVSPEVHLYAGNLSVNLGDLSLAENYLDSAILNFNDNLPVRNKEHFYSRLAKNYAGLKNYREAYKTSLLLIENLYEIYNLDSKESIAFRYDSESKLKIKRELEKLSSTIQIQKISLRNRSYIIIAFAFIFLLLTLLIILTLRDKKKIDSKNKMIETQKEELILASLFKDKLYSIISHDIRNPLIGIKHTSQFIIENTNNELVIKKSSIISENIENLLQQFNNMIEWSNLQSNNLKVILQKINVYDLFETVRDLNVSHLNSKNIQLINNSSKDIYITGDKQMMILIFNNLLSNNIKYSYPNSEVIFYSEINSNKIDLIFKDFGKGMDDSTLEQVKEVSHKFFELGTKNERGSGLGLNIVYELLKIHGGKFKVSSKLGEGTTFKISLINTLNENENFNSR